MTDIETQTLCVLAGGCTYERTEWKLRNLPELPHFMRTHACVVCGHVIAMDRRFV